ncbi:MAG: hypothetical protein NAG76_12075 [Candidatus Pristimantibacillus lignocellulolyticus]|uniref:Uncharacterized protein n=1 Tax=Candidatus Pristimantibacillus lignocellulolyticus TaxID=2994561 RepID=A0A9J6Z9K2_9BACL|nr:MAG: hypothetical protein NAG76_12075 [Candidatus Pristimantibacillus lignocellulolyticus]
MKIRYIVMTVAIVALLSGCGEQGGNKVNQSNNNVNAPAATEITGNEGATNEGTTPSTSEKPDATNYNQLEPTEPTTTESSSDQILIIIDQTEKPIEGNSFDFSVQKRPEGYMLSSMKWSSSSSEVVNTLQEAIEHGGNGEDGFYISGNGQFMGFFYDDSLKGEKGTVSFTFTNDAGKTLTWEKVITLN